MFLEHRAEKWVRVFGQNDATTINCSIAADSEIGHDAVVPEAAFPAPCRKVCLFL